MIDPHQIQEQLKDVKLSSMTDLINFVIEQVYKMMSYDPIQDLSFRIAELQKPKGLDQIMIEQVKTLIEAILQQKQDYIRKDLQRSVQNNIQIVLEQQNTRRSLKQIDVLEMLNTANQTRKSSTNSTQKHQHQNYLSAEALKRQILQIRSILNEKAERRQYHMRILDIEKQICTKMSTKQTENIVQKFQQQVFNKISDNSVYIQKMQYALKKTLLQDFSIFKKDFNENNKVKQLKSNAHKSQKKLKKMQNQVEDLTIKFHKYSSELKSEVKDEIGQFCTLLQAMSDQRKKKSHKTQFISGVWHGQKHYNLNNMAICWSKQLSNDDCEQFLFEAKKSQILLSEAGYYELQILVNGCEQPPNLFINSEFIQKIQSKQQLSRINSYRLIEIINLSQPKNLISIRLESNNIYNLALLKITKIG